MRADDRNGVAGLDKPVILGFDGSEDAAAAIARAGEILSPRRALVVHVWSSLYGDLLEEDLHLTEPIIEAAQAGRVADDGAAQALVAEGTELALAAGFDAQPLAIYGEGNPWKALRETALRHNSPLIVVGARGRVAGLQLGSVSDGLLHHAGVPVLVVPGAAALSLGHGPVLIAYDGSAPARNAIEEASMLLRGRASVVANVWQPTRSGVVAHVPVVGRPVAQMVDELDEISAEHSRQTANAGVIVASGCGLDAQPATTRADDATWRCLLDTADDVDAAAMVVGARQLSSIAAALGSVSHGVVHHAARPVLVVPASER